MKESYEWNSEDSPVWAIMVEIVNRLRQIRYDVTLEEQVKGIPPENIIILKTIRDKDFLKQSPHLSLPGIWVTPIEEYYPLNNGEVTNDDLTARILVMIADRNTDYRAKGLRTYLKWQYQISAAMRFHEFQGALLSQGKWELSHTKVRTIETLEDTSLDVRSLIRSGVMVDGTFSVSRSEESVSG